MLSKAQLRYLNEIAAEGEGKATLEGHAIRIGKHKTPGAAAISFLNLIAKGYLETYAGAFFISDKGRMLLNPFYKAPAKHGPLTECDMHEDESI